jgi:hypothetical protein
LSWCPRVRCPGFVGSARSSSAGRQTALSAGTRFNIGITTVAAPACYERGDADGVCRHAGRSEEEGEQVIVLQVEEVVDGVRVKEDSVDYRVRVGPRRMGETQGGLREYCAFDANSTSKFALFFAYLPGESACGAAC